MMNAPPSKDKTLTKQQASPLKSRIKLADFTRVRQLFKELEMKHNIDNTTIHRLSVNNNKNNNKDDNINDDDDDDDDRDNNCDERIVEQNKELKRYIMKIRQQFNVLSNDYKDIAIENDKYKGEIKQLKVNNNDLLVQLEEAKKAILDLIDNFRVMQKQMIQITKKKEDRENQFKALLLESKEKTLILENLKKKEEEIIIQNKTINEKNDEIKSLLSKNNLLQIQNDNNNDKLNLACNLNEELMAKVNSKDILMQQLRKDIETSENNSYRLQAEIIRMNGQNTLLKAELENKKQIII